MMTLEQANALADLIANAAPAADSATLALINSMPGIAELWVTERTLSANRQIGPTGAAALLVTLEAAAESLAASETASDQVQRRLILQIVARLTNDGINIADPASLAMVDQLAQLMPGTPVAHLAPAIKAMVPSQAQVTIGRPATLADLTSARAVAAAHTTYRDTVAVAGETLNTAIDAALAPAPGD